MPPELRLLTSMLDAERSPAAEIIELYHGRWELETGFDILHTQPLERLEALRSGPSDRIRQELFALAVVYNLVRLEMARVAGHLEVNPLRISYRTSLLLIQTLWLSAWVVAAGRLPQYLEQLASDIALLVLSARRPRSYPRAVKLNDHRLKPEGLKAQGSGLKVRLQTPYAPKDSCQLCALFQFKDQPQHRAESRPAKAGGLNLTFRESR